MYGEEEGCIEDFVGKPEGKRSSGRPRRRWKYHVKIDLQKLGWWLGMD
jgi:hypothetical protein